MLRDKQTGLLQKDQGKLWQGEKGRHSLGVSNTTAQAAPQGRH